jgi:hypothetical protein
MAKVNFFVPFTTLFKVYSESDHSDGFYVSRCFCEQFECSPVIGDYYFTCDEETFTVIMLTLGPNTGIYRINNEKI